MDATKNDSDELRSDTTDAPSHLDNLIRIGSARVTQAAHDAAERLEHPPWPSGSVIVIGRGKWSATVQILTEHSLLEIAAAHLEPE